MQTKKFTAILQHLSAILLFALAVNSVALSAEETNQEKPGSNAPESKPPETKSPESKPPENKTQGKADEEFKPSEDISEDFPAPLPADI